MVDSPECLRDSSLSYWCLSFNVKLKTSHMLKVSLQIKYKVRNSQISNYF